MNVRICQALAGLVLAGCAFGGWSLQRGTREVHAADVASPSPAADVIVAALGGLRTVATEVIWFRAGRLQNEGRYAELAQLAAWLTFLEPRTPEVWAFAAENLAFNVSVMMPTFADRWRWVDAGIRLLRDDGLRLNPRSPMLYRELAQTTWFKVVENLDEAAPHYRAEWRRTFEQALSAEPAARTARLRALGLEEAVMAEVDAEYGRQDWADPLACIVYWSHQGLKIATKDNGRVELRRMLFRGLIRETEKETDSGLRRARATRTLRELRVAYGENPTTLLLQTIDAFAEKYDLKMTW